jgi:cytochrome c oxidase cbb3-type subunit 3
MPTQGEQDALTGKPTTGHEWDGIRELNTPLPKWWLYILYATIVWSIGYYLLYPAIPWGPGYTKGLLGWSQRQEVVERIDQAKARQAVYLDRIEAASLEEVRVDPDLLNFALAGGRAAFADNCAPCHGAGAAGAVGYPSLADDDWLWGGDLEAIFTTVRHGVRWAPDEETRFSDMPRFGVDGLLAREEIEDVAEYVLSLSDGAADAAAAERGQPLFEENCAACHGAAGGGGREFGAPRLNDRIWLYGGDKESVVESISNARGGVMPAWTTRLDEAAIKQLAIYVHALGGGE